MPDHPLVTVFTITYNQRAKVVALMRDLARQVYPSDRFEVLVLDDNSADGTATALTAEARAMPCRVTLLHREHVADYLNAKRWNECIAAATPEHEIFIQVDDVRVRPDFVGRHAAWHAGQGLTLVTGAKFEGDEETWHRSMCRRAHLAEPDGQASEITAWTAVWGASMSYSRVLVDLLHQEPRERPFDELMTGWGYHEVEFACRAAKAGARMVYDPAVGVFHQNHSPSTDQGRGIDHAIQKSLGAPRNERYVMEKHGLTTLPRW